MSTPIKCVIVDDESLARSMVRSYLQDYSQIECIGEFPDGLSAIKGINELKPDLIFLDIQMPRLTGLEVAELIDYNPIIVFITAFDQYAINAFELSAMDYLLKPLNKERFLTTIKKALDRIQNKIPTNFSQSLFEKLLPEANMLERVAVKNGNKIDIIPIHEIQYLEAEGDYVMIHTAQGRYLKDKTMKFFELHLNSNQFIRIHRSYIINLNEIKRIELFEKENYVVILKSGISLKTSSSGYKLLRDKLSL